MKFTRDGAIWLVGMIGAILIFLSDQFGVLQEAFPNLGPLWASRIKFGASIIGFVSAYLRMSPAPLSHDSPLANKGVNPDKSLTILGGEKDEDK